MQAGASTIQQRDQTGSGTPQAAPDSALERLLGPLCHPFPAIREREDLYGDAFDVASEQLLTEADFAAAASAGSPEAHLLAEELRLQFLEDAAICREEKEPHALWAFLRGGRLHPGFEEGLQRRWLEEAGLPLPALSSEPLEPLLDRYRRREGNRERFEQKLANLMAARRQRLRTTNGRPQVLISGGGPAGLIRALLALLGGATVDVVERRTPDFDGRGQTVVIRSATVIGLLADLGVLDFLLAEDLIFPLGKIRLEARIGDLERAFREIFSRLADGASLHLDATIDAVAGGSDREPATVRIRSHASGEIREFRPDLLVVADGKRSPLLSRLGIQRISPIRAHTGITAIFRNPRPLPGGGWRRQRAWWYPLANLQARLAYRWHRSITRRGRHFMAGTILQVPGQNYVGLDLDAEKETELTRLLELARTDERERRHLDRFVAFWARYAFEAVRDRPHEGPAPATGGRSIPWLPLDPSQARVIPVVSDQAEQASGSVGSTLFIVEGDALCTIHPGTAYGCLKAFLTARLFSVLLGGWQRTESLPGRLAIWRELLENAASLHRVEVARIARLFGDRR